MSVEQSVHGENRSEVGILAVQWSVDVETRISFPTYDNPTLQMQKHPRLGNRQ